MITFKEYLNEAPALNYDFKGEISKHLKVGEIVKPKFEEIKRDLNRAVEKSSREIFDKFWAGRGQAMHQEYGEFAEAFWGSIDSISGVIPLGKKLSKYTKNYGNTEYYKALDSFYKKWVNIANDFAELKGKIVTTTQKRAEKKEAETQAQTKRFTDAKSLTSTLMTHKDEFVNEASNRGAEYFKHHLAALRKAGGLDAIAPRPNSKMSRDQYREALHKRTFYSGIASGSIEQYAKMYADAAHEDYMSWVHKMTAKIGKPVSKSDITGSPWKGSNITVTCNDGEVQHWHTQMIINHSKYGKMFSQFPTRRKK